LISQDIPVTSLLLDTNNVTGPPGSDTVGANGHKSSKHGSHSPPPPDIKGGASPEPNKKKTKILKKKDHQNVSS
jgi:hypothetical protein